MNASPITSQAHALVRRSPSAVHRKADPLAGQVLADGLRVSAPSDPLEREAEATASRVMRMQAPGKAGRAPAGELQRACASCEGNGKKDKAIHRKPASVQRAPAAIASQGGSGSALPDGVRADMEGRFGGQDFSGVRVHVGPQANTLARSYNARAFTMGSDIYFGQGEYSLSSKGGQHLLAHELTHVVQGGGAGIHRATSTNPLNPTKDENKAPAMSSDGKRKEPARILGCFPVNDRAQLWRFRYAKDKNTREAAPGTVPLPKGSYVQINWGTRQTVETTNDDNGVHEEVYHLVYRTFVMDKETDKKYPFKKENPRAWIKGNDIAKKSDSVQMTLHKHKSARAKKVSLDREQRRRSAQELKKSRKLQPPDDVTKATSKEWKINIDDPSCTSCTQNTESVKKEARKKECDQQQKDHPRRHKKCLKKYKKRAACKKVASGEEEENTDCPCKPFSYDDCLKKGGADKCDYFAKNNSVGFLVNLPGIDRDDGIARHGYNMDALLNGQEFWTAASKHTEARPTYELGKTKKIGKLWFVYGTPDKKRFGWVNKKCLIEVGTT